MTRHNRIKNAPGQPGGALRTLREGTWVRCPGCQALTTAGDLYDGCPLCHYDPKREMGLRDMAAAAHATTAVGPLKVGQLSDKEYRRQMKRFGARRVA